MIQLPMLGDFMGQLKPALYDDGADRMNYFITPLILLFFTFCVMGKQYVGSPIQCFIPAEFKGGWEQYTEDYCFIQNTYYVPIHMDIPNDVEKRQEKEIGYYQWIPVVLAVQAVLCYLPFLFWKTMAWQTGVNVESILRKAQDASSGGKRDESSLRELATLIEDNLGTTRDRGVTRRFLCFRFNRSGLGSYVTFMYLIMKILNACNIIGQFFLMNSFLSPSYQLWGLGVLRDLINGREWQDSGHFPRVTLCDFAVRRLGNIQRFSVQCVLMMNMFNEKIYIFLWFWFLLVAVITFVNLIYWSLTTLFPFARHRQVGRFLRVAKSFDERDCRALGGTVTRFAERWLRVDGLLLLRFIGTHNGELVSTDLVRHLWDNYLTYQRNLHQLRADAQATLQMVDGPFKNARSNSTKSSSANDDDGFAEDLFDPGMGKKGDGNGAPLLPSAPPARGYPGPPISPPKPKLADV